jgi:Domain of unknown function (DUF4304)
MDSSVVNKTIRAEIWPFLKSVGFALTTARTAWRHKPDRVDVINFQSFNSYNAGVLGITTFSFAVNLGCYLRYIPDRYAESRDASTLREAEPRPQEYQCQMRRRLIRSYPDRRSKDKQIWYIDEKGSNVSQALHDVRMLLLRDAYPWFERFASPSEVYDILAFAEEDMGQLWGFGRPGSPIRCYYLGYTALAARKVEEARVNLLKAAATKSFEGLADQLRRDADSAS